MAKKNTYHKYNSTNIASILIHVLILMFLITILIWLKQPKQVQSIDPIQTNQKGIFVLDRVLIFTDCLRAEWTSGESMLPTLEPNSYVLIDVCYPNKDLKVGDIIAFFTEENINGTGKTMHRIIEIDHEKEWVITKGDNNNRNDDIRSFEYIYGKKVE